MKSIFSGDNHAGNISLLDLLRRRFQLNYLPPAERLENNNGSLLIIILIGIICAILLALLLWASFAKIEETAVTFGEIVPKDKAHIIQHLEGGIVSVVYIKEGEEVKPGQLLLKLDSTAVLAELQQLQSKAAELVEGTNDLSIVNVQLNELRQRKMNFAGRLETLEEQLVLQKKELTMYDILVKRGAASERDHLRIQQMVNQTEGEIDKTKAEYIETEHLIKKLDDRMNRLNIKSPIHGLIQGLQIHPGSVIQPGGVILEIIPLDEELVVETKIATTDIGHIKVGDHVKIKVRTFDYTRYGMVTGKLTTISATTFSDEKNVPYYKGTIRLDNDYVGNDPTQNRLLPGMTVEADIDIGTKSLMKYLLKPIQTAFTSSFHER